MTSEIQELHFKFHFINLNSLHVAGCYHGESTGEGFIWERLWRFLSPTCFTDDKTEVLSGAGGCPRSFGKLAERRLESRLQAP